MALTKVIGAGAEGLTLSSTSLTVANGLTLTDGNVTLASGHGIDFAATANSSATGVSVGGELFDDYEVGSWTPIDLSGASLSLSATNPVYTRIGRIVICNTELTFPSNSSSSQVRVGGLPFTVLSGTSDGGFVRYSNSGQHTPLVIANSTNADVVIYTYTGLAFANSLLSTKRFDFTVIYRCA